MYHEKDPKPSDLIESRWTIW